MKIDIQKLIPKLQEQEFSVKEGTIAGDKVYLITPQHMGTVWDQDNLIFRSSIWSENGLPISLGFRKFFNFTEKPELIPDPVNVKKCSIREKIDGSLLCISKYKGEHIIRTRGTFSAMNLENGTEIDYLIQKYPKVFCNPIIEYGEYTILCEWYSPLNRIVIDYGPEPDIFLIGVVKHEDYSYTTQKELEHYGVALSIKTTPLYTFDTISNLIKTVETFKGKEGVCIYFNNDQDIKKVKGVEYLTLHRFKSDCTLKNLVDMFLEYEKPDYNTFLKKIETTFDYECMHMASNLVSDICSAYKEVQKIVEHMKKFVEPLRTISRKEAAEKILSSYGKTTRSNCLFKLLDGKEIDNKMYKSMLFQKLGGENQ